MLRRSAAAFIVACTACIVASCGIKGPLKPVPAKPAAPEAAAPSAPATQTPAPDTPAPDAPAPAPGDKKQ